jgi:hypothetical protein
LKLKNLDIGKHVPIPHLLPLLPLQKHYFIPLRDISRSSPATADMILSRAPLDDCNYNFK